MSAFGVAFLCCCGSSAEGYRLFCSGTLLASPHISLADRWIEFLRTYLAACSCLLLCSFVGAVPTDTDESDQIADILEFGDDRTGNYDGPSYETKVFEDASNVEGQS